jgi:hypothetical protein
LIFGWLMLIGGNGGASWHEGVRPHLRLVLAWPKVVRGSLATCTGGPAVVVPAAAAAGGAPVAVAVGEGTREMQRELRKATAQSA